MQRNQRKKNLMSPIDLANVDDEHENNMKVFVDETDNVETKDIFAIIDKDLPMNMRPLYLKYKFGTKLTKSQRTKIQDTIREILAKHGYS
jgi:hypothetical protein